MPVLVSCLASLALPCLASPESDLEAQLPEIFAKSAAHYKALDAAATPLMKVRVEKSGGGGDKGGDAFEYRTPHGWLKWKNGTGGLDMRPIFWWTSGHFPGSLWYLYEGTGDDFFKDRATVWTEILAPVSKYEGNHDVGFMMFCSYGNARRILKTDRYDALLRETAATLSKRYNAKLGLIRSWGKTDERKDFLVIPDNLMNLELMAWAGGRFGKIAVSHADVTMKHHFRPDGGCFHVLDYDQRPAFLGRIQGIRRGQGASCETAWSRGQSWGIYGYTMMYRATGFVRYLDFAKKLADYAMNHPSMPADGIPCWDYGAPGEERDSSAGSVMASALLELSQYVDAADRARYRAFAVKQLLALASPAYFSEGGEIGHFLLKHGVGAKPFGSEVDSPLDYGDYYFLEALLRFRELRRAEAARADVRAKLPPRAHLPATELSQRARAGSAGDAQTLLADAERVLGEPIPDTSDALYGEYWTTGNRTHYQKPFFLRLRNSSTLALAENAERKGRFLPRLTEYLAEICRMKTWVLPAHDWTDGGRGNFRGTCPNVDLFSSEVAAQLACVLQLVGDRLDPALVRRVKDESERRIFGPLRHELAGGGPLGKPCYLHWWVRGENNWNAVCWDNAVCAALGLLDDPEDRALFVKGALASMPIYLSGFSPDGYCSEGMGYWNYGFGHHLRMGRLLRAETDGRIDVFTTEIQKKVGAYARAYTLCEGISPAFADGNGAADPRFVGYCDEIWPDLPKDLPPASEFPDGQVWLFRDPKGLSVAFKGGHNDEFHNHNDVGSYYVVYGDRFVSGDPGGEEYTRFTFSKQRYESKVLNSYGHPVPVVGGKLQGTGRKFAAKVVGKKVEKAGGGGERNVVVLDLTAAYDVQTLKSLTRTFVYDRVGKSFAVTDRAEFSAPTAFESAYDTYRKDANAKVRGKIGWDVRPGVEVKGGAWETVEESVANPNRISPQRVAVRMKEPVLSAEIAFRFDCP